MVLGIIAVPVMAETTARIWTDKADYSPEETVTIYGEGFQGKVNITVIRPDGTINDPANNIIGEWTVDTDENGAFETTYILDGIIGVYTVNAIDEGGNTATMTFTDAPKVGSVTVGAQSPNPVAPGSNATYTITVNRGSGSGSSGLFTATLSITTSLPTGASASFSPNPVSFEHSDKSKTATLTITTNSSTPAGSYSFTVKAATSETDYATGVGTLNVQAVNRRLLFQAYHHRLMKWKNGLSLPQPPTQTFQLTP
jgi:hypothetical protein